MSQPWLDDLSEDWVPQAASSPPSRRDSSAAKSSFDSNPPSRSRIPRLRFSPAPAALHTPNTEPVARQLPGKRKSALAERSNSDNNILNNHPATSPARPNESRVPSHPRSISTSSADSVVRHGTVEIKSAMPLRTKRPQDTPEWKRRLIHGKMGYGDQKDLFSPMGLENIFQQPTTAPSSSPGRKKGRLSMLKDSVVMPSSPPPWPSQVSQSSPSKPSSRDYDAIEESMQSVDRPGTENSVVQTGRLQPIHEQSALSVKDRSRIASGQTELTDDSFSPVYISRRNTKDGGVEYQPLDLSKSELERVKNQSVRSHPPAFKESLNSNSNTDISTFSKLRSEALPEDLPTGTPDHLNVGQFVNLNRGGHSADGSFRQRALSPSPLKGETSDPNETSVRQDDSQATVPMFERPTSRIRRQFPRSSSPPLSPKTPARKRGSSNDRPRSSGSPLKLFGDHDTFTANRLIRRMSQLEDAQDQDSRPSSAESPEKRLERWLPSVEEGSFHESDDEIREEQFRTSNGSYFGRGELDNHRFPEEEFSSSRNSNSYGDEFVPNPMVPEFKFNLIDGSVHQSSVNKRKLSRHTVKSGATTMTNKSSIKIPKSPRLSPNQLFPVNTSHMDSETSEGKRPPTSPFKNPQPKRRRTLLSSELGDVEDFSYDKLQLNDAQELLTSRPRNPTPSEIRLEQVQRQVLHATDAYLHTSPKALHVIQEHVESPSSRRLSEEREHERAVANEIASYTVRMNQRMRDEDRKRSVTTQDFLDQARLIMDHIRTRGRPNSALESLAESESPLRDRSTFLQVPESPLSFSRSPSREGWKDGWRNPAAPRNSNARVVSHLKRYQETEGDDFMMASFRSNNLRHYEDRTSEESRFFEGQSPDIRILTRNLTMQRRRDRSHSDDSPPGTKQSDGQTSSRSRRSTLDSSFGKTNATGISRRSENVANLAPDAVAHLIPQELAGMTFDREKGIWVKRKAKTQRPNLDVSNITTSDDDPLKNIPDLTVDELNEKRQVNYPPSIFDEANSFLQSYREKEEPRRLSGADRPQTREGAEIPVSDTNSAPSKYSVNLSSSAMQPDTRATSLSDKHVHAGLKPLSREDTIPEVPSSIHRSSIDEHVQKELSKLSAKSFHKSPSNVVSSRKSSRQKSFQEEEKTIELPYLGNYQTEEQDEATPLKRDWAMPHPRTNFRSVTKETVTDHSPTPPRHTNADFSLVHRAEVYSEQGNSPLRFSVSIARPLKSSVSKPHGSSVGSNAVAPYSPKGASYTTFLLSELPEFTLNQIEEKELPNRLVKQVVSGDKQVSVLEDRFAQGTVELVKALQDEAPEELFWEDLRTVGLRNKDLPTLHRLDELCARVENLDVSNNHIAQLTGAPPSIRRLNIENNCLTSLTGWGHLVNLQYLDVSGNALDSLIGFKGLVHLREIKADNNQIEALDGVLGLDALIKLSVRNNKIRRVDLRGCALDTLTELDLGGNAIKSIRGLEELPCLEKLGLDDNQLAQFPTHSLAAKAHRLRNLSLNRNRLMSLSLSRFPSLVSVSCDSNHLPSIADLGTLRHLRILSARDQQPTSPLNASSFFSNPDLSELYLSANAISQFTLPADTYFLNLQRLELANCGLVALPERFGLAAPNIRALNLNANAVKDLRPLLNMKKLRKLEVAGNRLQRLRRNILVLSKLGPSLKTIDMRNNPFNVGFYAQPLLASTIAAASTAALALSKAKGSTKDSDGHGALPRLLTAPPAGSAPGSFTSANGVTSPTFSPLSFPSTVTSSFISHPAEDTDDDDAATQAADDDPFTSSQRFYASPHPANLHSLPPQPASLDANYRARLDADTALRRKVYEMLVAHACEGVKRLDGLAFDRTGVLSAKSAGNSKSKNGEGRMQDDAVWARLVEVGVVRKSKHGKEGRNGERSTGAGAGASMSAKSFESVD
ncbi:hypothetical protein IWZ01DRAFT_548986 [Phyllosticta capitalensis]